MATGDILSCTIRADGWSADVVIEGFAPGATYDFGSLDDSPATTAAPKFAIAVTSEGYSASGVLGTINRTVYGTKVVRKPYPNQATPDETGGGNLTVRVALSESVYNDDKNGGAGTSGTDPAVTIAAGWCVNTAGGAQSSAAATALVCTNNSTLDYPKAVAQWAWGHTPAFLRVESDFTVGALAYHGHGIACVAFSAVGAVSAASVSGISAEKTKHQASASGLSYTSYDLSVPASGYTQAENIKLNFVAYPLVGDADSVVDTSVLPFATSSADFCRGLTEITCTCDKTGALKDYAVVSTTGNDTTGAKSTTLATAVGTPYLTVGKALASGATVVYCRTGTYGILGSTPASVAAKDYCVEVSPYPGESATLNRDGTYYQYKARHLSYSGFTIAYAGSALSLNGQTTGYVLRFVGNTLTASAAPGAGSGLGSSTKMTVGVNNTWTGRDTFGSSGTSAFGYCLVGNSIAGGIFRPFYTMTANVVTGTATADETYFQEKTAASGGPVQNNVIVDNNRVTGLKSSGVACFQWGLNQTLDGFAFIGNLLEAVSGSQPVCAIAAAAPSYASSNFIVAHNTTIGERSNLFYNGDGAAAVYHNNAFCRANAIMSYNIKSDVFTPGDGARIGNWAQIHGVNYSDNRYDGTAGLNFTGDYDGINVAFVAGKDTTFGQMGYTDDNSAVSAGGDGTGNGDYLPAIGSPLRGHTLRQSYLSVDMLGNPINQEIGAFQVLAAAVRSSRPRHIGHWLR